MDAERACEQCGEPIPQPSRADKRFCTTACRVAAHAGRQRRARIELVTAAPDPGPVDDRDAGLERLREALDEAMLEPRLLNVIAAEVHTGRNWRAAAWLLEHVHGWTAGEVRVAPRSQSDELAAIRARIQGHRR